MIFPFDPPFRFLVDSTTRNIRHLVDISANGGFGQCTCEHHSFRCQPEIDRGAKPAKRCPHILSAREAFADDMIHRLTLKLDHNHNHDRPRQPSNPGPDSGISRDA